VRPRNFLNYLRTPNLFARERALMMGLMGAFPDVPLQKFRDSLRMFHAAWCQKARPEAELASTTGFGRANPKGTKLNAPALAKL
jgi:hypothetical protein